MNPPSVTNPPATPTHRGPILICLGLILVYPLFSVPVQASIKSLAPGLGETGARVVTEGAVWLYAALVLAIALYREKRTLASIGLGRFRWATLWLAPAGMVAMAAAGVLGTFIVYGWLKQPQHSDAQAAALVNGSVVYALCLAVRAGVIEEIFYRGLAIEQLTILTGSRGLAASVATVVFVVIHVLHFDWIQMVPIAAVSVVLAALYLWKRNLWANILAHVTVDAFGLVTLALQAHKPGH